MPRSAPPQDTAPAAVFDQSAAIWTPHRPERKWERLEGGKRFQLVSEYEPAGDQPTAIRELVSGLENRDQDQVLLEYPNVHTNIWNYGSRGWLDRGIAKVGARKFMFGSDGFLNSLSVGIGPVVFGEMSDDEKRGILGLNVARLLNSVAALPASLAGRG